MFIWHFLFLEQVTSIEAFIRQYNRVKKLYCSVICLSDVSPSQAMSETKVLHSSDMSIIQKFLTNQIAANEIIIVMTPYCPKPQHLLHMEEGLNLISLKSFGESK